jgi:type I restriction enzyme S subunit
MEIRSGYKQTEVGVIPEDWEVKSLDALSFVTSGKRLPLGHSLTDHETPHPYIRVTDMRPGTVSLSEIKFVPVDVFPSIKRYRIFKEDIFISVAGTLGIVGKIPPELDGANLTENADRITSITCSQDYLLHVLMAPPIQNTIESLQTVGAQPKLALTRIRRFTISLPPTKVEQEAIAEALSDADDLIEILERLLAKKRDLKQGAMQELLTGKKRLPGFEIKPGYRKTEVGMMPEDWDVRRLKDVVDFANGKPYEASVVSDGRYWLITLDSVGIDGRLKAEHKRTNVLDLSLKKNDIVSVLSDLAHGDLLGLSDLIPTDNTYVLNQRMGRLRLNVPAEPQFVRLQINHRQEHFRKRGQGTSQKHIYRRDFDSLSIPFPAAAEQEAIAAILSDMDAEIAVLEAKLVKARDLKQGMAQQLLTGRIRLV